MKKRLFFPVVVCLLSLVSNVGSMTPSSPATRAAAPAGVLQAAEPAPPPPIFGEPIVPFLSADTPAISLGAARSVRPGSQVSTEEHLQALLANILTNSGFEEGSYSPEGDPTAWARDAWNPSQATLTWDNTLAYSGSRSVKITNHDLDDARWIQTVAVQPDTEYRLSGWIKTESVAHSGDLVDAGANLSIYGTYTYVGNLYGTNDWTYVSLTFNSGPSTEVTIAARLGYWYGITTGTAWFDDVQLEPLHTASPDIANPGFESGSGSGPDDWWTETIVGQATFTWDLAEAHSGLRSVKISAPDQSSVRWAQTVQVDPDSEYQLSGWIKTRDVQDPSGQWWTTGAKLGIYGMDSYLAAATPGLRDTHDWTRVSVRFITGDTGLAKVVCTLGEADPLYARPTSSGTMWCDDLTLTKIRSLPRTYLAGEHVALDLYTDDWLFDDPAAYIARLDDVYEAMAGFANGVPFGGDLVTVRSGPSMYYGLLSGNPILIGPGQSLANIVNEHGIDFGVPHELGHDFDLWPQYRYYMGQMRFDNAEHWANFKVTYAYDVLSASHPALTGDIDGQTVPLAEFSHRGFVERHAQPWLDQGRTDYWNMHNDTYTGLLYTLREQEGWGPFIDTFHHFSGLSVTPPGTDEGKVELFAQTLSSYAGTDLTPQFRSWGFPLHILRHLYLPLLLSL